MARAFAFSQSTINQAWIRQWNRCAMCGEDLTWLEDHAHHVIPNQVGKAGDEQDAFLRELDNCVVLCADCHQAAHGYGNYRTGAVPPPDHYRFSHGKEQAQHSEWLQRVRVVWETTWSRKFPNPGK
jgi:hypothetical protein